MLQDIDLSKKMGRKEFNEKYEELSIRLSGLQRECRELGIPVIIVFEGFPAAGKGTQINQLIGALDPRGFRVYAINGDNDDEKKHPYFWKFWIKTPEKGKIAIFDRSWYRMVMVDRFDGNTPDRMLAYAYMDIIEFEEQLTFGGTQIIKFFLDITKAEQKKRMKTLLENKETAWRVTESDLKRHKAYKKYREMADEMLQKTDTGSAPWVIVEANDKEYAAIKIMTTVIKRLEAAVEKAKRTEAQKAEKSVLEVRPAAGLDDTAAAGNEIHTDDAETVKLSEESSIEPKEVMETVLPDGVQETVEPVSSVEISNETEETDTEPEVVKHPSVLSQADLSLSLEKDVYRKQLKELQARLSFLHSELYRRQIPVVLAFEGWDAGGKGGAIKRLTQALDPRGYQVNPTSSPNDIEKAHHYLWRFWNNMPKDGHIAIFDRTWYGRVMVERIEGFATEEEWKHAYNEINNMEAMLHHSGAIVLKFWMQIDKDEQERRFKERQSTPYKQWKITDEDWRNRAKWDQYEEAVDEMIVRTNTDYAPWIIVEGNDKYYARIKVIRTVIEAIESRLRADEAVKASLKAEKKAKKKKK